jgi:DNA-binding FadR family transcriptional regulator
LECKDGIAVEDSGVRDGESGGAKTGPRAGPAGFPYRRMRMRSKAAVCGLVAFTMVGTIGAWSNSRLGETIGVTQASTSLRENMRKLWSDHVIWTRQYIVAAVAGDSSAPVALSRLMRNQEDLGNAVKPFYGDTAGAKLTALLEEHISIAGELVAAAKAADAAKQADADRRWHGNAADIASFLATANPNWSRDTLLGMLNQHLALTTREATDRLRHNWTDDQATFDKIYSQALEMADALSAGIHKQFPRKA